MVDLQNGESDVTRFIKPLVDGDTVGKIRYIDIELTNACNTSCVFCPREKISRLGKMDLSCFQKTVHRIEQLDCKKYITFCGLGEPLIHPDVVSYVSYLSKKGLEPGIATNGFFLTKDRSEQLLDAGLRRLSSSISGINEQYEKIHELPFDVVKRNIMDFLNLAQGRCSCTLSITICEDNRHQLSRIIDYWKKAGINDFIVYKECNRGGALDIGYYFVDNNRFYSESQQILRKHKLNPVCLVPYVVTFMGWDGEYYMCCNDYQKKVSLGNVADKTINEIDRIKYEKLKKGFSICKDCDVSIDNKLREILIKIDKKEAARADLDEEIKKLVDSQKISKIMYDYWEDDIKSYGN